MRHCYSLCLVFLALIVLPPLSASAQFIDAINPNAGPEPLFDVRYAEGGSPIGWYYTPDTSYLLDGIFGGFEELGAEGSDDPISGITFSVYDERPVLGGVLLRETSFDGIPITGGVFGGNFDELALEGGDRIFIGLSNMAGIGVNLSHWQTVNGEPELAFGATTSLGIYFRDDGNGFGTEITEEFETTAEGANISASSPILFFSGTAVPEPASGLILVLAGASLLVTRKRSA